MQLTTIALAFSEWGIGRFPLDLIVFLSVALIFALPAGINRKKIFVEGDAFTTRFPGRVDNAIAAAIDFPMMYMSGAPVLEAAGSAASMFMNNPNLGKAVNIGLEQSALSDEEKFLQRATQRREGIESAIKSVPSKFQSFIERNRGPADESFTSYFDGGIVSALKGVK